MPLSPMRSRAIYGIIFVVIIAAAALLIWFLSGENKLAKLCDERGGQFANLGNERACLSRISFMDESTPKSFCDDRGGLIVRTKEGKRICLDVINIDPLLCAANGGVRTRLGEKRVCIRKIDLPDN